jgi:hypothetical protein
MTKKWWQLIGSVYFWLSLILVSWLYSSLFHDVNQWKARWQWFSDPVRSSWEAANPVHDRRCGKIEGFAVQLVLNPAASMQVDLEVPCTKNCCIITLNQSWYRCIWICTRQQCSIQGPFILKLDAGPGRIVLSEVVLAKREEFLAQADNHNGLT